ncbi:MAG: hypothetical protein KA144_06435 [Xanthomonadaceae bacterium]|nr:hypothetical protein [Xanthomonadaceae bacterium]
MIEAQDVDRRLAINVDIEATMPSRGAFLASTVTVRLAAARGDETIRLGMRLPASDRCHQSFAMRRQRINKLHGAYQEARCIEHIVPSTGIPDIAARAAEIGRVRLQSVPDRLL